LHKVLKLKDRPKSEVKGDSGHVIVKKQ
jgi:hypothetical protein